MIAIKLFLTNEVHGNVIFVEVVWHFHDLLGYLGRVSALFQNNPTLTRMLFARGELGIGARTNRFQRLGNGNGVLTSIGNTRNTTKCIGMTLGNATTPKRIVKTLGQDAVCIQTIQREQTWIPTTGNQSGFTSVLSSCINIGKMSGNLRVGIEGIYHVIQSSKLGCLLGQVGCATTTQNQNINIFIARLKIRSRANCNARRCD
ncbi:unknown [Eggerthella sp. CAG:368]|nr:unknown [Eggerthella sp. CAG:368]